MSDKLPWHDFFLSFYSSTALYTRDQLKETLNAYIESYSLVNRNQRQFININDLLRDVLATKGADVPEFMKREDLLKRLIEKMQAWYRIEVDGKDPVLKYVSLAVLVFRNFFAF